MAKEFVFTKEDFAKIQRTVKDKVGINLGDHKFEMVYGRLARRLRVHKIKLVDDYLDLISDDKDEHIQFINAITTNLTYFFREGHHFEFLADKCLRDIKAKHLVDRRVRIWSAGCSTGEEPYSIAETLKEFHRNHKAWDYKILATDLDTKVLATARAGVYDQQRVDKVPASVVQSMFDRDGENYIVKDELKHQIAFKQLNLMSGWPMKGKFDVIFCRNVLIYFNRETQQELISRFHKQLYNGGYLILGHSESIGQQAANFEAIGRTIFQKV
ncbi:MAG: protein-glutamate O-methyltransferase CheR [Kangiellaceae bacterium]|jgi:chemotaxis protein methyltransferase CheR|nr:protein-glutamate O-methyltransferase CheR [Kangiellaceae bacterium]